MKAQHPETWAAERIIKLLEQGGLPPWKKGWKSSFPQNMISKREYSGLNRWMLLMAPYGSPFYLTIKNAQSLGGRIKREEFSNYWPVYFWMVQNRDDKETGFTKKSLFCKGYKVWNIEQCEGIDCSKIPELNNKFIHNPIAECEKIVSGYSKVPPITPSHRCFYSPSKDEIGMPSPESFEKREEYYCSLFHEFGHSTGHAKRLNRDLNNFDKHSYSKEELVAEFCAAMLCAVSGIEQTTLENSAAYIEGWLSRLRGNTDMLVFASREANKACNFILNTKFGEEDN